MSGLVCKNQWGAWFTTTKGSISLKRDCESSIISLDDNQIIKLCKKKAIPESILKSATKLRRDSSQVRSSRLSSPKSKNRGLGK